MNNRLALSNLLHEILGSDNVYYQPPEMYKIQYPAIIYRLDDIFVTYAGNIVYNKKRRYLVTYIDSHPDSEVIETLSDLPECSYSQHYTKDNLNYDVFSLYY